jgi:HSP20 family protein
MKDLVVTIERNKDFIYESDVVDQKLCNHVLRASGVVIANLYENAKGYEIRIIATGYSFKNFSIYIGNHILKVIGDQQPKGDLSIDHMNFKFSFQTFTRNFHLPPNIDEQKINTRFKDGILIISLPKKKYLGRCNIVY